MLALTMTPILFRILKLFIISVIPFKANISAAKILKMVGVQNFMRIPNLSIVWSLEVKFSSYGPNKVIKGVKIEIILIS